MEGGHFNEGKPAAGFWAVCACFELVVAEWRLNYSPLPGCPPYSLFKYFHYSQIPKQRPSSAPAPLPPPHCMRRALVDGNLALECISGASEIQDRAGSIKQRRTAKRHGAGCGAGDTNFTGGSHCRRPSLLCCTSSCACLCLGFGWDSRLNNVLR